MFCIINIINTYKLGVGVGVGPNPHPQPQPQPPPQPPPPYFLKVLNFFIKKKFKIKIFFKNF